MVKIYCRQIIAGKLTIYDVPYRWREDVIVELENRGYEV